MHDDTPHDPPELDDADLASLLSEHHELENVHHMARMIGEFYQQLREHIDPALTSSGDIHDVALELTREWMTYTMGDA